MFRKAEMGVGTLIIFIALLLVAAVAAGVLITTAGVLQERALATGKETTGRIATHIEVIEVSATNGTNETLNELSMLVKLSAGSTPVRFQDTTLILSTERVMTTLSYIGNNGIHELNSTDGYYTFKKIEIIGIVNRTLNLSLPYDLDNDGQYDRLEASESQPTIHYVYNSTERSGSNFANLGWCTAAGPMTGTFTMGRGTVNATDQSGDVCVALAHLKADGENIRFWIIEEDYQGGNYTAEYIQKSTNYIQGILHKGDVVRIHMQAPEWLDVDEPITVKIIPKIGSTTTVEMTAPEAITAYQEFLYP